MIIWQIKNESVLKNDLRQTISKLLLLSSMAKHVIIIKAVSAIVFVMGAINQLMMAAIIQLMMAAIKAILWNCSSPLIQTLEIRIIKIMKIIRIKLISIIMIIVLIMMM